MIKEERLPALPPVEPASHPSEEEPLEGLPPPDLDALTGDQLGNYLATDILLTGYRNEVVNTRRRNKELGDEGPPVDMDLLRRFIRGELNSDINLYMHVNRLVAHYDAWLQAEAVVMAEHYGTGKPPDAR